MLASVDLHFRGSGRATASTGRHVSVTLWCYQERQTCLRFSLKPQQGAAVELRDATAPRARGGIPCTPLGPYTSRQAGPQHTLAHPLPHLHSQLGTHFTYARAHIHVSTWFLILRLARTHLVVLVHTPMYVLALLHLCLHSRLCISHTSHSLAQTCTCARYTTLKLHSPAVGGRDS